MNGVHLSTDQHLHQQGKELWPRLGPVPVGDGGHGVGDAGADFADRLPQPPRQQLLDGGFSLAGRDKRRWI